MSIENLWDIPALDEDMHSTEKVKEIIIQQADFLEKYTNNNIEAKFGKLKVTGAIGALIIAEKFANIGENIKKTEVEGISTSDLEAADKFYTNDTYGFEIYSSIYRFRVFEIRISPMYPVFIRLDEDIFDEIKHTITGTKIEDKNKRLICISSETDLTFYLKEIFQSKKVRFIIQKMLKKANEKQKNDNDTNT